MKVSFFMLVLLCICAAILTSLLVYSQYRTTSSSDAEIEKVLGRSESLQTQVNELLKEQVRLSQELRAKETELRLAAANPVIVTNVVTNAPSLSQTNHPAYTQPFLAKTYLDGEYVGLAKVSPVYRTDKTTGGTVFENVIHLSGDARGAVVKTVTNVVEREVVRNTTLNNNYTARPYWYAYPVWVQPNQTNRAPGQPTPQPPTTVMPPSSSISGQVNNRGNGPWQNGGVWKPDIKWKNPSLGNP